MLHVTNGDAAAGVLHASGVGGEVLPWRDVLHEGPVPGGLALADLSAVRARFIAGMGWGMEEEAARDFAARDAELAAYRAHGEVVLWFEHDLYDQLQLLQVLDYFAAQDLGPTRLAMVCGAEYLGPSTPQRLAERFGERRPVTDGQLALAQDAWNAFRSPDPTAVLGLLARDTGGLPYLAAALARHLEQFPSTANGLSRSEQQALEEIAAGAGTVGDAFAAHQRREDPIWLGDSTFAAYLQALADDTNPLLTLDPPTSPGDEGERQRAVRLTGVGRAVLANGQDRVRLNGIDRWLGGVHLTGREAGWRWDAGARTLVPVGV